MTEYDYSPDAYERFQAKMAGVGDWVSEQRHHAPKYSNPFLTEESSSSSSSSRPHTSRADDASRHKHHQDRPQPSRSRTLPNPATGPSAHGHTSRAYAYAQQAPGDPHKSHHRSARSPQRSGSLPPDPRYASASATYAAAPMPAVHHQAASRASPVTYAPPAPAGYRTRQVEYKYVPGQPVVLPPPRPGETYVIIPPKGGRVDVVPDPRTSSHSRSQSASRSTSRSSGSKASSPTKKSNDALLKRLLTNLTPNVEWGHSSSGSRSTSRTLTREPHRRRSTSR